MKLSDLIEQLEELRAELQFLHGEEFDPEVIAKDGNKVRGAAADAKGRVWVVSEEPTP